MSPGSNGQGPHVQVDVLEEREGGSLQRIASSAIAAPDPGQGKRPNQQSQTELRDQEPDVVEFLFKAHERLERQTATVEIPDLQVPQLDDDGKLLRGPDGQPVLGPWQIRIKGLHQDQIAQAERKCRRIRRTNSQGKPEYSADPTEMASWVIYLATVPEDRQRPGGWDDRRMWDRFQVGNGIELIDAFLRLGDKKRIGDAIEQLSNLNVDDGLVPNSSAAAGES